MVRRSWIFAGREAASVAPRPSEPPTPILPVKQLFLSFRGTAPALNPESMSYPAPCPMDSALALRAPRNDIAFVERSSRTRTLVLAAQSASELCQAIPLNGERAQGRPDVWPAPMARLQTKSRRQSPQVGRNNRPSLCDGFNAYTRSPRGPAVLPPSLMMLVELHHALGVSTGTPGPHDFTSVDISVVLRKARPTSQRPPHPALNVRDDREAPLSQERGTATNIVLICPTRQAAQPATEWHDGQFADG